MGQSDALSYEYLPNCVLYRRYVTRRNYPMTNPIEQIHQFNHDAGLIDKGYNDFLESSFQIEEALEGFPYICDVFRALEPEYEISNKQARDTARAILNTAMTPDTTLSDVDRLDKACDAVVFAIGSMTKLGLTVDQITRSLNAVMHANFQKLTMPKDSMGKLMKNENFIGPEEKLQQILDERTV